MQNRSTPFLEPIVIDASGLVDHSGGELRPPLPYTHIAGTTPMDDAAQFLALALQWQPGEERAEHGLSTALSTLARREDVVCVRLFRHVALCRPDGAEFSDWSGLALIRLAISADAQNAAQAIDDLLRNTEFPIMSSELLKSSPASLHEVPSPRLAGLPVVYSIEYIHVTPQRELLDEYRSAMRLSNGPALQLLVSDARVAQFIALERIASFYRAPGMPEWNQIHLAGIPMHSIPLDPDSLVTAVSRQSKRFLVHFDEALRKVSPAGEGYDAIFRRLDALRRHTRHALAKEVQLRMDAAVAWHAP